MKKFTLLMVTLLLSIMGANAKTVTTTTTLTIGNDGVISSNQFASASVNDVITFSHATSAGTHFKLFYKIGGSDNWAYHKFTGVTYNSAEASDYYTPWINYENTYTITITSDDLERMKNYGIWLEDYATVTGVTLTHSETEDATNTTSVWTGEVSFGTDWTKKVNENIASTSGAKIGDVIQVTFSNATTNDNAIWICKSNAEEAIKDDVNATWGQTSATSASGTLEFEITDAVILEAVQSGIMLKGKNATVTAVSLLTYASSYDAVAITVGSDGIATYSNGSKDVQISVCDDLKAYYASAVAKGTVTLTELTGCIPANQGVIIKGAKGTYTVKVGSEGWEDLSNKNYLKPSNGGTTVAASTEGTYHYIFAKKGDEKPAFYKLTKNHTLAAHKAYLETSTDITPGTSGAPLMLDFGNGTTAIMDVFQDEMKQQQAQEDNVYYTLQGTRVQNPTKGLYILNGKKIIVK